MVLSVANIGINDFLYLTQLNKIKMKAKRITHVFPKTFVVQSVHSLWDI